MKMYRLTFLCIALFLFFVSYSQTPATIGPEKGSLIIVGGGTVGPEIWTKFVELARGAANEDSSIARGQLDPLMPSYLR